MTLHQPPLLTASVNQYLTQVRSSNMKTLTLTAILAMVITLTLAPTIRASMIIYEPFNYTIGTYNPDPDGGVNGGNGLPYTNVGGNPSGTSTGLRNAWSSGNEIEVVNGLTYSQTVSNLTVSGGAALDHANGWLTAMPFVYRFMTTDPFIKYREGASTGGNFGTNGPLYFSFLMKVSQTNQNARLVWAGSNNEYIGYNGTDGKLTIAGAGTSAGNVAGSPDTTLIVGTASFADYGASAADYLRLWINPPLGGSLGTPNLTATNANYSLGSFTLRTGAADILTVDEIRLGESLADVTPYTVIPEPTLLGLLAIAGVVARKFIA
ncbi:MAG: hypothetical protein NTV22_06470 [bacterium]|nr:hypothetical protein [bacterium]